MTTDHVTPHHDNFFIKVLIPATSGGAVIGKGGEALVNAQTETGTKVKVSRLNEYYPGTTERTCLVQGDLDGILKMVDYITKCISDTKVESSHMDRHRQTRVLIPNTSAGLLIGKEGENINEIKKVSGAYIQVSSKTNDVELMERTVVISGDIDQRRHALRLVLDRVIQDPKLCFFPHVNYGELSNSFGGHYGMGRSSPPYASLVYDNLPHRYHDNWNANYITPPHSNSFSTNPRSFTSSFQQLDIMASDSIYGITRTLEIDEELVGAIIGPKGQSIIELQEITDTDVKVSRKTSDVTTMIHKRVITINGMYENVCRAYLLINDKIRLEQARREVSSLENTLSES